MHFIQIESYNMFFFGGFLGVFESFRGNLGEGDRDIGSQEPSGAARPRAAGLVPPHRTWRHVSALGGPRLVVVKVRGEAVSLLPRDGA